MRLGVLAMALSLPTWPADLSAPGIPNFNQVNEHVFRGGQPTAEGWQSLAKLGVKTVIDLRRTDEHSPEAEAQEVTAVGMRYVNVPMKGVVSPSDEQITKVLSLLDSQDPVFVHCKRGADRTGTVIACYRIAHDHWARKQALREAKSRGMGWTQLGLKSYIMTFQPTATKRAAVEPQPSTVQVTETPGL
jgi:protein tyrosine/serine phosphatase